MLKNLSKMLFSLSFGLNLSYLSASEGIANPADYQKNSSLQWKWAMESLEAFPFEENDRILDLGCGSGSVTYEIAKKVPAGIVVGLDISESMLAYAKEHYQASNIIYMEGDARALPFTEQFDKAVALLALNWIKEEDQALDSLCKALKSGGKLIITRPGKQASNLGPVSARLIKTERWASYFSNIEPKKFYYSAKEYTSILENAGFIVDKISEDSTYTYFENREALVGFFRPLCIFTKHLSFELQEQFVDEVVDVVLESNQTQADGSILLHDFKLEAIVSKP